MKITKVKISGNFISHGSQMVGEKYYGVMTDNHSDAHGIVKRNCVLEGIEIKSFDSFETIDIDINKTEILILFFKSGESWCLDTLTAKKAVFYNRDDCRFFFVELGHSKEDALQKAIKYFLENGFSHNVLC